MLSPSEVDTPTASDRVSLFQARINRRAIAALATVPPLFFARSALATENDVLLVGPMASIGRHAHGPASSGVGIELTYNHFPRGFCRYGTPCGPGFGAVTQAQLIGDHQRILVGFQATFFVVGVELGTALESANGDHGTTLSAHVAPFWSIGVASVGVRVGIPYASLSSAPAYRTDVAAVFTLKLPLYL